MGRVDNVTRAAAVEECRRSLWQSLVCSHTKRSKVLPAVNGQPLTRVPPGGNAINADLPSGGLGDLFRSGLGGLLATGAAGGILSGGLSDLLKQFQQTDQSDTANSWVGTGPNKAIAPNDLASALGAEKINTLVVQTGMSRDDLLQSLSEYLPQVVDQLTPQGRLPTEQEVGRML
jgi:uncharacterized protein YidB (DUF937 family)